MKRLLLIALAACGSSSPELPTSDNNAPIIYPVSAHSGFDGTSKFQVPIVTNLVGDVTWTVDDPAVLDITPVAAPPSSPVPEGTWAMVVTKRAGTVQITARVGDDSAESTLEVKSYDPALVAAGKARYMSTSDPTGAGRGCASCHLQPQGADHSPTLMAYYADDAILSVITTGRYPDGRTLMITEHAWSLTATERDGIVPYLRTLPPRGF